MPVAKVRELLSLAASIGAQRLKRHDAEIAGLKLAVSSLLRERGKESSGSQTDQALLAALFDAGLHAVQVERLSELYESMALRIANLEMAQASSQGEASEEKRGSVEMGRRQGASEHNDDIVVHFERILAGERWKPFGKHEALRDYFNHIVQQYRLVVEERDGLLNLRDQFIRERQDLTRGEQDTGARPSTHSEFPAELLDREGPCSVTIVDVGAQNLESEDHIYSPLVRANRTRVVGFEPLEAEAANRASSDPSILMLNHFIGDGSDRTFRVGKFSPTSSLLEPNQSFLAQFVALPEMCQIVSEEVVSTTRLDDVPEVRDCDFLKIDVQGGELDVLRGASTVLERAVVVHSEVEFCPVYKDQPLFSDVDLFLRARGFELIELMKRGYASYQDLPRPLTSSRLMWADAVYFMSPDALSAVSPQKLIKAAYIAHENYGMYDLAARYLRSYDECTGADTKSVYGARLCAPSSRKA